METVLSLRPNTEDLWESAVATLSQEDRNSLDFDRPDRLQIIAESLKLTDVATAECKAKAWRFKRKSGEEVVARDVLAKIARWMNHLVAVGDTVVQYDPAHAALPWAGIRFLLQICVDYFETHERLLESIQSIAEQICRCDLIEKHLTRSTSPAASTLGRALVKLYANILIYLARVKAYFQKTTKWQVLKGLTLASREFDSAFKAITDAQIEVAWYVPIAGWQGLSDDLARLEAPMARWSDDLTKITDGLDRRRRGEILRWISQEPYQKYHKRERETFLDGTGKWLLFHPVYKQWKNDSASSILWLHGIPGSGKSKLTSLVIEDAQSSFQSRQAPPPAYFYCSRNPAEPGRSDAEKIIASIVRQLSSLGPGEPLLQPTVNTYDSQESYGFAADSLQLQESCDLLMELLQNYPTAIIIIDALDECSPKTRQKLLDSLERVLRHPSALVKVFVSSRDDGDIVNKLRDYPSLELSSNLNSVDISNYVEHETRSLVNQGKLLSSSRRRVELSQKISEEVSNGAQGMFRWASLQLEALCELVTDQAILERLGRLPPTLEALYQEILDKIQQYGAEADRRCARNALAWLLCGRKRLSSREFLTAVSTTDEFLMEASITGSAPELLSEDQVLRLCRNLIVFDATLDSFRFAHLSVREFLESKETYSTIETNSIAAQCCFTTLKARNYTLERSYLHSYANCYWAPHCQSADVDRNGPVQKLLHEFLLNTAPGSPFSAWNRYKFSSREGNWDFMTQLYSTQRKDPCGIYVASAFDFVETVKFYIGQYPGMSDEILEDCASLSALYGTGKALNVFLDLKMARITGIVTSAASNKKYGKEMMVSLFEKKGDQIEITADTVEAAAINGQLGREIILFLLEKRSEQVKITESVLSAAVWTGADSMGVLPLLFEKKGDEIMITTRVLRVAAGNPRNGREVMSLILEKKDDQVRITEDVVRDAVHVRGRSKGVLDLLFEKRGDEIKITPPIIRAAARNQHEETMALLLEKGGDHMEIFTDAVETAAGNEDCGKEIMALLLEKKGDEIEITKDVVMAAVCNVQSGKEIMALLLEKKSDQIEITADVVLSAARCGSEKVMALLLEKTGSQIQLTTDVVIAASCNEVRGKEMMALLLEARRDEIEITTDVIIAAARNEGGPEIMSLLLEKMSDKIKITTDVVIAAAGNYRGRELMSLLLEKKGDEIDITTDVLVAAAHNERGREVIALLLEKRGDQTQITEDVVIAAASSEHESVMALLLEKSGNQIKITTDVLKSVAANSTCGEELMALLLGKVGDQVKITRDVVIAAASNQSCGVMSLLLEQRGDQVKITPDVVTAAAGNSGHGQGVMTLLLEERGNEIEITTDVITAACCGAVNREVIALLLEKGGDQVEITTDTVLAAARYGNKDLVALLLEKSGNQIEITTDTIRAAADNKWSGDRIIAFLLEKDGNIKITTDIVEAVAGNSYRGDIIMAMLLEKGSNIQITADVVKAAAGNKLCGREIMGLLFENGDRVEIPADVIALAASLGLISKRWRGKKAEAPSQTESAGNPHSQSP
ncbi:hypothetical protein F4861DRAFT_550622 [Xylaria intraflava]|nr:hypothetical protein F4861DRAFT_550622 [Xylaria intraflava]